MPDIKEEYAKRKKDIKKHLESFNNKNETEKLKELLFCVLTPQSNAEKCWEAVNLIHEAKSKSDIQNILKGRARFHNTKSDRILSAIIIWPRISSALKTKDKRELRNWIAETMPGYGLKEAGHFLRNIGHSENKIAILDRHILRNLKSEGVIEKIEIKGHKGYIDIESSMLKFSDEVGIPSDDLDLLFWHKEHGRYFK